MEQDGQSSIVQVAISWQSAANNADVGRLLQLSDPNIEIIGPRGSGRGHQLLKEWLQRAGLTLTTLRTFVRGNHVVMAQRGVWSAAGTGEASDSADVASYFQVDARHVMRFARYDSLDTALSEAGLNYNDEISIRE